MLVQKCCNNGFLLVVFAPSSFLEPKLSLNLPEDIVILPGTSSEISQFGI
jgi:hypothetical protein